MSTTDRSFFYQTGEVAILLLHSYTSSPIDFRTFARLLSKAGFSVYGPVLTHHGGAIEETIANPDVWIEDGYQAVEHLKSLGYKKIIAFGVSLGGLIAMHLIANSEDVLGGGAFCAPLIPESSNQVAESFVKRFVQEKKKLAWTPEEIGQATQGMEQEVRQVVLEPLGEISYTLLKQFAELDKPVLIAQGAQDTMIDPQQSRDLLDYFHKRKPELIWYENGRHVLTIGRTKQELADEVIRFVNSHFV